MVLSYAMPISIFGTRYCRSRTFVTVDDVGENYVAESVGLIKTEKLFFIGAHEGDHATLYTYYYKEVNSGGYAYTLTPTHIIETNSSVTADDLILT